MKGRYKSFQRGGRGVYKCAICERSTREAGQGNDRLCPECWELAGFQNVILDEGKEALAGIKENVDYEFNSAVKKGGNAALLRASFPELFPEGA